MTRKTWMAGISSAKTRFALLACHDEESDPEDRETQDQQDQEDHDEDIEQEAGDVGRCGRYAGETEDTGDDRHQKEDQRPFENCHRPSLQPAGRRIRGSYKKSLI